MKDDGVQNASYVLVIQCNGWLFYEVVVPSAWRYRRVMFFVVPYQLEACKLAFSG